MSNEPRKYFGNTDVDHRSINIGNDLLLDSINSLAPGRFDWDFR